MTDQGGGKKILPCPFCGESAGVEVNGVAGHYRRWMISCENARCNDVSTQWHQKRKHAIAAWNRRIWNRQLMGKPGTSGESAMPKQLEKK